MKYVATVEIEFETKDDPLETLQRLMHLTGIEWRDDKEREHWHIVEQPKELK